MTGTLVRNPFVGPRSLRVGEPLLGRDAELEELVSELKARRVVVLHAPAGAGKSSLVHAGLVPRLKRESFDVWKPIRANANRLRAHGLPEATNRFVLSAIASLEDELPEGRRRSLRELAKLELATYVHNRPRRRKRAAQHVVLIFDELDDVLGPGHREEVQRGFFDALGRTLAHDGYWALLVVRDELLAQLNRYQHAIPTQLANTIQIDHLGLDQAKEVASTLARAGGRSFSDLDALVAELSKVRVEDADGEYDVEQGAQVEAMQLQVVGRRLWDATPEDERAIDWARLGAFGDVSTSLATYYSDAVRSISAGDIKIERELRNWIERALIVNDRPAQLRYAEVARLGPGDAVIEQLEHHDIVHVDALANERWLELAHPRLVRPILANNEAWAETYPRLLAKLDALVPTLSRRTKGSSLNASEDSWVRPLRVRAILAPASEASSEVSLADATESSWINLPINLPGVGARERSSPQASAGARELVRVAARRRLEVSADGRDQAMIGLALASLALDDPRWTAAAEAAQAGFQIDALGSPIDALLGELGARMRELCEDDNYADLPDDERPSLGDGITALVELGDALCNARGAAKREMLRAAFRAGFRAEYFTVGLTSHLWAIARRIEYPELRLLEGMLREHGVGAQIRLRAHEHGAFFVRKLCELGLAVYDDRPRDRVVVLSEIALTFGEFLGAGQLAGD